MNRRDLLSALPALGALVGAPVLIKGEEVGKSIAIEADKKYVVFLNAEVIDIDYFCKSCKAFPTGTPVYAVDPRYGSLDEIVRIFKIE